ncbi:MAG: hypothetical protein PHV82_14800 [Victivallaceae bacterium]|nr:hypothetical protein [Victivallaceae bacterium]
MKVDDHAAIGTGAWRAEFALADDILMNLYLGERLMLKLKPAVVNKHSETQCLPQKARIHHRGAGISINYEVSDLIPFGPEPGISRDFDFTDGFARVVQDIDAGKNAVLRELALDAMSLPGPWRRIAVVRIPGAGKTFPELKWIGLEGEKEKVFFAETYPFLAFIAESPDGKCFEVGCGDDLWRWGSAADLPGCTAEFRVSGNKDSLEISRCPVLFDAESGENPEASRRTWRFKWYFAWSEPGAAEPGDKKQITVDMSDFAEPGGKYPCMHAKSARKKIRQALRGIIGANENTDIVLTNAETVVCNQEGHLERGTKKNFLHWDAWDLMELFIWANCKAMAAGCTFSLAPPVSGKVETPLFRRLTRSGFQNICGE